MAAGEAICSLGYSEPGGGSDVFAAQTRATPDGNGWRIDGQKMFTSGANLSDYVILITRTNPDLPKHKGLTLFIAPLKAAGVTVQPVHTFQDERTNITYYDGVRIPDSYRLGEVDGGVKVMSAALEIEHGSGYAKTLKRMLAAGEELCREISYRGRPLIEDPSAQTRLARLFTQAELATVLNERILWATVEKKPAPAWGPMARVLSAEAFLDGARDLLDLTAPHSLSKRSGPASYINQCYRHAHATRIYGGTQEVHRSMIAERNLGLPRTRA
jgi:alkylation response protein AidB-like acyl-CoA dehydrogenase